MNTVANVQARGAQALEMQVDIKVVVDQCRAGCGHAWETLIRVYSPLVWTVVRSHGLGESDCEDVYQLTWQRLVEHIGRLKQPGRVGAWLVTVAKRESISRLNQQRKTFSVADVAEVAPTTSSVPTPEEDVFVQLECRRLLEAVRRLPEQHQILLGLLFADPPLGYDDIAVAVDMPRGSIGPTRKRILARLRGELTAAAA